MVVMIIRMDFMLVFNKFHALLITFGNLLERN